LLEIQINIHSSSYFCYSIKDLYHYCKIS